MSYCEGVERVLEEQLGKSDAIRADSELETDLGLDHIDRIEFALRLEREFLKEVPDDVVGPEATPNSIAEWLERHGAQRT